MIDPHCNTLRLTAKHCIAPHCTVTHRNTLRPTAIHYHIQHTTTKLQHTTRYCSTIQHAATHVAGERKQIRAVPGPNEYNILQDTKTNCTTLQHTAPHCSAHIYTYTHTTFTNLFDYRCVEALYIFICVHIHTKARTYMQVCTQSHAHNHTHTHWFSHAHLILAVLSSSVSESEDESLPLSFSAVDEDFLAFFLDLGRSDFASSSESPESELSSYCLRLATDLFGLSCESTSMPLSIPVLACSARSLATFASCASASPSCFSSGVKGLQNFKQFDLICFLSLYTGALQVHCRCVAVCCRYIAVCYMCVRMLRCGAVRGSALQVCCGV